MLAWAAAVRAEYFDVEEDAFWENDGPQEPRKTVKPKTTAPRIAKRDRAQLSLNQMVTFASQGWIRCVKCIPELRDPGVAAALDRRSIADKKPLSVGLARLVLYELHVSPD